MPVLVLVLLLAPPLQNLDTALQGLDTWHSFHYLAVATVLELPDAHGVTACSVAVGTEQGLGRSRGGSIVVLVCGCRPVIV